MFGRLKLKDYSGLILAMIHRYKMLSVGEFLEMPPADKNVAILVHPVERMPERASAMALAEKRLGLRSSYYFQWDPKAVNWHGTGELRFGNFPELGIVEAKLYGHEIGYFPTDGDHASRLAVLRSLAPVRTSFSDIPDVIGGPYSSDFSDFARIVQNSKGWTVNGARSNLKSVLELLRSGKHPLVMLTVEPENWK